MPNMRSIQVINNTLTMVASDGRTFTLSKQQVIDFFKTTTGNAANRKAQTVTWLKQGIENALGADQVPLTKLTVDCNTTTGEITLLEIVS